MAAKLPPVAARPPVPVEATPMRISRGWSTASDCAGVKRETATHTMPVADLPIMLDLLN
jgi:hypothetical protein